MATPALSNLIQTDAYSDTAGVVLYPATYVAIAPSAAGDTVVGALSNARNLIPVSVLNASPAAGSAPYTYTVSLSATYHQPGDIAHVKVLSPASTNPTVVVHDASATGTTLLTITAVSGKQTFATFVFTGTAWVLLNVSTPTASASAAAVTAGTP